MFALGQAVGLPRLEPATDALTSQTGQWLVVAFFAVLLIGAAQKGVPTGRRPRVPLPRFPELPWPAGDRR